MSHPSAIAAVTETLRSLIAAEGIVADVTAMAPDLAASPGNRRVNLFLYHIGVNAALRNQEFPWQGRGGGNSQTNPPPFVLPLQLHYLLTSFADDDVSAHEALGHAMRVLHDHAQLTQEEIESAVQNAQTPLPDSNVHLQPEKVKVSLLAMSTDEMTKIWTAFQSAYRLSVGYEVSVVLIESSRPSFTPLPVLRRGAEDRGPVALAGNNAPVLTALFRSNASTPFTTGFAGDEVVIEGVQLGDAPVIRLRSTADPAAAQATTLTATRIAAGEGGTERCLLTLHAAGLPAAGPLALSVEYPVEQMVPDPANPGTFIPETRLWHSNEVTLSIAAQVAGPSPAPDVSGAIAITLPLDVPVLITPASAPPESPQRLSLLLNGRETAADVDVSNAGAPVFLVNGLTTGDTHGVRLRVDGVDLPVILKDAVTGLLSFQPDPTVTIP
jgi:hypothetical protein